MTWMAAFHHAVVKAEEIKEREKNPSLTDPLTPYSIRTFGLNASGGSNAEQTFPLKFLSWAKQTSQGQSAGPAMPGQGCVAAAKLGGKDLTRDRNNTQLY